MPVRRDAFDEIAPEMMADQRVGSSAGPAEEALGAELLEDESLDDESLEGASLDEESLEEESLDDALSDDKPIADLAVQSKHMDDGADREARAFEAG